MEAYTEGVNQLLAANTSLTENMAGILNSQTLTSDQKVAMMGQVLAAVNTEDNQALLAQLAAAGPQLTTGAQALEEGIEAFSSGAGGLNTLVSGLETLSTALDQLEEGTASAVSGSSTLQAGLTQAKAGSEALVSGAQTLLDAGTQLEEGSAALSDGIETAQTSVDSAVAEAQTQIEALDGLSEYAEDPVNVEESPLYEVPNYGTAFAPYFMSLSLYVGALIMFVGLYLDIDEKIKILARNSENKFIRVAIFALIGVAQALLLALLVKYALGLTIANTAMYYLSCILVSMVFITIVEFFFVILGDAGKFLAMLLLILQLTSCGGTFPMETVPKFFQVLYPYMPMTYSVLLFKETISGYDAATANHAIVILLLFFAGFLALTLLFSAGKKGHQKHHPDVKENAVLTA